MRIGGSISTTSVSEAPVEGTTYTEPTVGAQRAVKSGNAADAAAGTGARKVRITYYTLGTDGAIAGPFTEDVTLNGVTAVPTVATNIALIEKLEVISVGSGGVAAGIIVLTLAADGTGGTIASIAAGALRTAFAHHYVPSGRRCLVSDLQLAGGDAAAAYFELRSQAYPKANVPETVIVSGSSSLSESRGRTLDGMSTPYVAGPARMRLYVTPANTNAQVSRAEFGAVTL